MITNRQRKLLPASFRLGGNGSQATLSENKGGPFGRARALARLKLIIGLPYGFVEASGSAEHSPRRSVGGIAFLGLLLVAQFQGKLYLWPSSLQSALHD